MTWSDEHSTKAHDKFEQDLLNDQTPLLPSADLSVIGAVGLSNQGPLREKSKFPTHNVVVLHSVDHAPGVGQSEIIPLRPWRGPIYRRLDNQAADVRKKLNTDAVMLVMRGTTFSARSAWGVFWIYCKTRFFGRLRKIFKRS